MNQKEKRERLVLLTLIDDPIELRKRLGTMIDSRQTTDIELHGLYAMTHNTTDYGRQILRRRLKQWVGAGGEPPPFDQGRAGP